MTTAQFDRLALERRQVWVYLLSILAGLMVGHAWPAMGPHLKTLLWPALLALLFSTFVQVPLLHLRAAFGDRRFVAATLTGNFILLPLLVWALIQFLPADPALRLGVLLVLLVPCTDWFITFSQLGGGNAARAIVITPVNLLLQLLLLPFYLWLMSGEGGFKGLALAEVWPALAIVLVPLALAAVTEKWIEARPARSRYREQLAWAPVPLLGLVVFLIAGAQSAAVARALPTLALVAPVFAVFLLGAALIAKGLARAWRLPTDQGRTLAFTLGTRNSFVVLPIALALPAGWEIAAAVIVAQSLVELFGMLVYLRWVPGWLFRSES